MGDCCELPLDTGTGLGQGQISRALCVEEFSQLKNNEGAFVCERGLSLNQKHLQQSVNELIHAKLVKGGTATSFSGVLFFISHVM